MIPSSTRRQRIGVVLLAAGLLGAGGRLISLAIAEDAAVDDPAPPPRQTPVDRAARPAAAPDAVPAVGRPASGPAPRLRLDRLDARQQGQSVTAVDLFAVQRPASPAPAAAAQASAPPPPPLQEPVPAFPYRYLGGMVDGGVRSVFFLQGERVLALRAGDVVDRKFRVDEVAGDRIMMTFLPRNAPVTVSLGTVR